MSNLALQSKISFLQCFDEEEAYLNVKSLVLRVFLLICDQEPIKMVDLSEQMGFSSTKMSSYIVSLQDKGLVGYYEDPENRAQKVLILTQKGLSFKDKVAKYNLKQEIEFLKQMESIVDPEVRISVIMVLLASHILGPVGQVKLVDHLKSTASRVSRGVEILASKGLLEKSIDPDDQRMTIIEPVETEIFLQNQLKK